MKIIATGILMGILCGTAAYASQEGGVLPATMEKYQKVRSQVDASAATPAAKFAPEVVEQARKSIATAQDGLKNGDDQVTREFAEMAVLQLGLAGALADERQAAAATDIVRKQVASHENRLANILAGKGDK